MIYRRRATNLFASMAPFMIIGNHSRAKIGLFFGKYRLFGEKEDLIYVVFFN